MPGFQGTCFDPAGKEEGKREARRQRAKGKQGTRGEGATRPVPTIHASSSEDTSRRLEGRPKEPSKQEKKERKEGDRTSTDKARERRGRGQQGEG